MGIHKGGEIIDMVKKLVELDAETMFTKVVDEKRLYREAEQLKGFLLTLNAENDANGLRDKLLPICDDVLTGKIRLPLKDEQLPVGAVQVLHWEGSLPAGFKKIYGAFYQTAVGGHVDFQEIISRDGKCFAWMEFED